MISDAIYKTARAKFTAVVAEIEKAHKDGPACSRRDNLN